MKTFFSEKKIGSYIGSEYVLRGHAHPHISPVTHDSLIDLIYADQKQTEQAINASQAAFLELSRLHVYERAHALEKIADFLLSSREDFAKIITLEMGKPITEARAEVDYTAGYFSWFAQEAKRIYGKTIPSKSRGKRLSVIYQPIGPTAIITPWNFPLAMAGRKIAPAIAAGCSVICRPSSYTPLSLLMLGNLFNRVSLPKGSFQVLIGEKQLAEYLLQSPVIRKLSFTGSNQTGETLYRLCSQTTKKITMELGGHAPAIIFGDANLEQAVRETIHAKFRNSGQTCVCANRIFIQKTVFDDFLSLFCKETQKLNVGNPLEEETQLSSILHPSSLEKTQRHLKDACQKGALTHLNQHQPFQPQILTKVTQEMLLMHEETFGPLAPLISFSEKQQAIEMANQTKYGLAAYIFTDSLTTAQSAVEQLHCGIVGINDGAPSSPEIPFGGVKASGFGREGGPSGIYEYLQEKSISQRI